MGFLSYHSPVLLYETTRNIGRVFLLHLRNPAHTIAKAIIPFYIHICYNYTYVWIQWLIVKALLSTIQIQFINWIARKPHYRQPFKYFTKYADAQHYRMYVCPHTDLSLIVAVVFAVIYYTIRYCCCTLRWQHSRGFCYLLHLCDANSN